MSPTRLSNHLYCYFLFLSLWVSATAQRSVMGAMFGSGSKLCTYQFAIPSGQACGPYVPTMGERFKSTRQELEGFKRQFVKNNMALLEQIRQLRQQTSTDEAEVADVTKDLKTLQAMADTLRAKVNTANLGHTSSSNSSAISDVMVKQMVNDTRQQMTQDMDKLRHDLDTAVTAINRGRRTNGVQQSSVDSAFQAQLQQQQSDLASLLHRLQVLRDRVSALQAPNNSPYPPPSAAAGGPLSVGGPAVTANGVEEQVQSALKQLEERVWDLEDLVRQDVPDLRETLAQLEQLADNQTHSLSSVSTKADELLTSEIPALQQKFQVNSGAIQSVSNTIDQVKTLETKVKDLADDVSSLVTQATRLGTDTFNQRMQMHQDEVVIRDLGMEVSMLAARLTALIRDQHLTTPPPSSTLPPSTTTFAVPTPAPHH